MVVALNAGNHAKIFNAKQGTVVGLAGGNYAGFNSKCNIKNQNTKDNFGQRNRKKIKTIKFKCNQDGALAGQNGGNCAKNLIQNATKDQNKEISAAHRARRFGRFSKL